MKTSILATAALAALSVGSAANAAVTITVTNLGVPTDGQLNSVYGPLTGYHAYSVTVDAGAGALITGVDFSGPSRQITATLAGGGGALHQFATLVDDGAGGTLPIYTPTSTTVLTNGAGKFSYDSHLVIPTNVSTGSANLENNDAYNNTTKVKASTSQFGIYNQNFATSTPADGWGNGTNISGANGFNDRVQTSTIAYLVIADSVHLLAPITVGTPEVGITGTATAVPLAIVIPALTGVPEPTSLALMGMASAGLLARRRRNA